MTSSPARYQEPDFFSKADALVTLATGDGQVAQRSATTPGQRHVLHALDLPEPPRYFQFTPAPDAADTSEPATS